MTKRSWQVTTWGVSNLTPVFQLETPHVVTYHRQVKTVDFGNSGLISSALAYGCWRLADSLDAKDVTPQVEASVPQALAKTDRLDIRPTGRDCSQQAWPNFEVSCLRVAGSKTMIRHARLVTTDRTP